MLKGSPAAVDDTVAWIEESVVTLVREATLPSLQERFVAEAGVAVERAGYLVLRCIAEHGPARVGEVAQRLGVDASTVSRRIRVLEERGLLARAGDPSDGRVARLALTGVGAEALGRLRAARHRLFAEVLADWPAAERDALAPLLARLAKDFSVWGGRQ